MIYESIFVHFNKRRKKKMSKKKCQGHHDASLYDSENNFLFSYGGVEINAVCHQDLLCSSFFCAISPGARDVTQRACDATHLGVVNDEVPRRPYVTCPVWPIAAVRSSANPRSELCKHYARMTSIKSMRLCWRLTRR